jgi:transcriptional regulator with XRE-family HTH domain
MFTFEKKYTFMELKLRQQREKKGLSQEQMAEYLNISQSQYYRKEIGTSKIQEKEWDTIAKILEVDKNELRDENNSSNFNIQNIEGSVYSSHVIYFSEQLTNELKEHIVTLKEKNDSIVTQYEHRIKEKDDLIAFLKGLKN